MIFTAISVQNASMTSVEQRHRVLAGISRARLLAVLRRASEPMDIRRLADAVELHPNTAREHLDQLVEAGLVLRSSAPPRGRGRPGWRYAAPGSGDDDAEAYRSLAAVLADELARRPDADEAATSAGVAWGRSLAEGRLPVQSPADGVRRLVELLDEAGFAPEAPHDPQQPIRLHRCPFGSLARRRGDVVCNVHLGLMHGALRQLGAPLDAVSLEPFVEPNLCLAHLGAPADDD